MTKYNDQKTKVDRVGKKLKAKCDCGNWECKEYSDPYLEVARENMQAVESANLSNNEN